MLSQENIYKLCFTGIYKSSPEALNYTGSYPWHCRNWTFRVQRDGYSDGYVMVDTYWSTSPNCISLTDENFDKFKFLFDLNDVEEYKGSHIDDYANEDCWKVVPMDSGGIRFPKKFIKKGSKPVKEKVVARLNDEMRDLERRLNWKREDLRKVLDGEVDLRYV